MSNWASGMRAAVASLVAAWIVLYLPHLRTSPSWYGDETISVGIGLRMLHGELASGAHQHTFFWHPYQAPYCFVVGLAARLVGGDILGARALAAVVGLGTALVILIGARRAFGLFPAWVGAASFLAYSQTVMHFRMALPHGVVALGYAITATALLGPPARRRDWTAGAGIAVAAAAHPFFYLAAISGVLARWRRPRSWVALAVPSTALVALVLAFTWVRFGRWLLDDLASLAAFHRREAPRAPTAALASVGAFWLRDGFHLGALAMFLLAAGTRTGARSGARALAPWFVVGTLLLVAPRDRALLETFYYRTSLFLPVLGLGWAAGASAVVELAAPTRVASLARAAFTAVPLACLVAIAPDAITGRLRPGHAPFAAASVAEVEAAARFVDAHTTPDDLVVASSNVGWLLHARRASWLDVVAWNGGRTYLFERGMARDRFLYEASLEAARYAVVADTDRKFMAEQPGVRALLERVGTWPLVFSTLTCEVRENPAGRR